MHIWLICMCFTGLERTLNVFDHHNSDEVVGRIEAAVAAPDLFVVDDKALLSKEAVSCQVQRAMSDETDSFIARLSSRTFTMYWELVSNVLIRAMVTISTQMRKQYVRGFYCGHAPTIINLYKSLFSPCCY